MATENIEFVSVKCPTNPIVDIETGLFPPRRNNISSTLFISQEDNLESHTREDYFCDERNHN